MADKAALYETAYHVGNAAPKEQGIVRGWTVVERAKSFYLCQLVANADIELFEGVNPDQLTTLTSLENQLDTLAFTAATGDARSERQR